MYKITDWQRYEVNSKGQAAKEGQELRAGPLRFIRLKVHGHSQSNGYRKLLEIAGDKAMEVFGIFCKFLEIAGDSAESQRGILRKERDGEPATNEDLSFLLSTPVSQIENAVKVLSDNKLNWITETTPRKATELPEIPRQYNTIQYKAIKSNRTKDNTIQELPIATDSSVFKRWLDSEMGLVDLKTRRTFGMYADKLSVHRNKDTITPWLTDLIVDCKEDIKLGKIGKENMIRIVSKKLNEKLKG